LARQDKKIDISKKTALDKAKKAEQAAVFSELAFFDDEENDVFFESDAGQAGGEGSENREYVGQLYEIRLKDFDGPFDTLCHLIRKSKYSIEDVKISDITEQYLEFMKQIDELDLEKATEFITMAAWLLEIKSKALLPKQTTQDEEYVDEEQTLKQQLEQYELFKDASKKMKEIESVGSLFREPEKVLQKPRFEIKDMHYSGLMEALKRMFLKLETEKTAVMQRHIVKDRFTVEEKITHILEIFEKHDEYSFFELFDEQYTKSEIITTFQALLELLKGQQLKAEQSEIYGDITLKKVVEKEE
jgi:segregation and condensation protein A